MGFALIIFGLPFLALGWWLHLRARAKGTKAALWPTTQGTVLTSEVGTMPFGSSQVLVPLITYAYEVAGQKLQSGGVRVGGLPMFNNFSKKKAAAIVALYPVGSTPTVHYNPESPADATLELKVVEGYGPLMAYTFAATMIAFGLFSLLMHF